MVCEIENDHFEEVACSVRADHEKLRRVVVLVHVDHDDRVIDNMLNGPVVDAVPSR